MPTKLCECGCGRPAPIATKTSARDGWIKGKARRFINGHNMRRFHADHLESYGQRNERGCLIWPGSKDESGYGTFYHEGRNVAVHRFVLEKALGRRLRPGEWALHKCDTPSCYEHSHIFAGTPAENVADKMAKNRQPRGSRAEIAHGRSPEERALLAKKAERARRWRRSRST